MKITLLVSTRLGVQAAVAIALASLVGHLFPNARSYWAIATAILLISPTWGESVKKSIQRVAMTIAGGMVGTVIYLGIHNYNLGVEVLLLISAFLIIYFIDYSYLITIFFVTIWVVFLFAKIKAWSVGLLIDRIYETILGAFIAIIVSAVVLPVRSKDIFLENVLVIMGLIENSLQASFNYLYCEKAVKEELQQQHNQVAVALAILQKSHKLSLYEKVIGKKKLVEVMTCLSLLTHYLTSVLQAARSITKSADLNGIRENVLLLEIALRNNLQYLYDILRKENPSLQWQECVPLKSLQQSAYAMDKTDYPAWLSLNSLFYFLSNIDQTLRRLKGVLQS